MILGSIRGWVRRSDSQTAEDPPRPGSPLPECVDMYCPKADLPKVGFGPLLSAIRRARCCAACGPCRCLPRCLRPTHPRGGAEDTSPPAHRPSRLPRARDPEGDPRRHPAAVHDARKPHPRDHDVFVAIALSSRHSASRRHGRNPMANRKQTFQWVCVKNGSGCLNNRGALEILDEVRIRRHQPFDPVLGFGPIPLRTPWA